MFDLTGSATMLLVVVIGLLNTVVQAQNIVQNGEMESLSGWDCWNIHCELSNDHHGGHHGIKASGRSQYYQGPSQILKGLKENTKYKISGWVKLLNDHQGDIGQLIELEIAVDLTNGKKLHSAVAANPLTLASDGWVHLMGDFISPQGIKSAQIYYQGPVGGVNFVVDSVSMTPIVSNTHWRAESDNVIDQHRKSFINFHVTPSGGVQDDQVDIEVIQTSKSFAFGTAVNCWDYPNGNKQYADFIHKHFNWAVTESSLKWNVMEPQKGHIDYKTPMTCLRALKSHGVKIRAHNILWAIESWVPSWVKALSGQTLKNTVTHRIQDIMSRTKDTVEHWDVNNEILHGFWFENALHDRDYNLEVFRIAHKADPNVKLFLNDYDVVASGGFTEAYREQVKKFKNAHVGLYGVGVQCHFGENVYPDPTLIKSHLDTIAEAGVPIWVTELDVVNSDENQRADWYETALRALYGHPAVEGIMLWGFWSKHHWRGEPSALVSGDNFRVNAAGHRFLDLVENQWMTNETHKISQSGREFQIRGFHGDYEIRVKINGKEDTSLRKQFILGKVIKDVDEEHLKTSEKSSEKRDRKDKRKDRRTAKQ